MYYFVFDLDGTLLNHNKGLSPNVIRMFERLRDAGHFVMVATGRAIEITQPYLDALKLTDHVILNNGAVIHDLKHRTNRYEVGLSEADKAATLAYLKDAHIEYSVSTNQGLFTTLNYQLGYYDQFAKMFPEYPLINHKGASPQDIDGLTVYKILAQFPSDEALTTHRAALKSRIQATVTQSMEQYLSILPSGITKGGTLKTYLADHQIPLDRLVVFGDNDNDAEMLMLTHHSYAMVNGSEKAKAAAQHVTRLDNDHDGVVDRVNTYLTQ